MIFEEGDPGVGMFVVLDGAVVVNFDRYVVETVPGGGACVELARLWTTPRSATARAGTDTPVALVDARRFDFLDQRTANFVRQILALHSARLRRLRMAWRQTASFQRTAVVRLWVGQQLALHSGNFTGMPPWICVIIVC